MKLITVGYLNNILNNFVQYQFDIANIKPICIPGVCQLADLPAGFLKLTLHVYVCSCVWVLTAEFTN